VFVQMWIGAEDRLPRMARAVCGSDPAHLRRQVALSSRRLDLPVPADRRSAEQAAL
jgi:hypothetical protein